MSHETARCKHRVKSFMAIMGAAIMAAALVLLSGHPASGAIATVQDTDRPNTQYGNWMFTTDPGASGGWESTTREPEASAKLKFKGTSVIWKTITYEAAG